MKKLVTLSLALLMFLAFPLTALAVPIGNFSLDQYMEPYWSDPCSTSYPYVKLYVSMNHPSKIQIQAQVLKPGDTWRNYGSSYGVATNGTHRVFELPRYSNDDTWKWRVMITNMFTTGKSSGSVHCEGSN
ncbi:hypothetical protein [Laceyella tengchongensis]|jgi:hypothetical protein|uniref:hypothetical protein n=1 Tax=Laceyella tengchongensis TaxID=574699 RepID=UPI0012B73666|nr:hypothetical protein [Laceyella tengchongensis]